MLYLHVSNRTENLLRHLVEVLRAGGRRSPFSREIFLIQSQGMERMISQGLAHHFQSWCNFEYFLPLGFLSHCGELLGMDSATDGYERRVMVWRLEQLLRDIEGEEYILLHHYLQGDNLTQKRFQLADRLANIFDQYQLMRPEMLQAWEGGRLVTSTPHELWQRHLWLRLRSGDSTDVHRGAALKAIIHKLEKGEGLGVLLPQRLSVFGLSIMPPLYLDFLQALGRHIDVHLYVLSPCREYWGDLALRRRALMSVVPDLDGQAEDTAPEVHPLLVAFGRQGRDFQRMLFADHIRFTMEFSSYQDPREEGDRSLLARLQSDLLRGEVACETGPWDPDDNSIHIVSCHSRYREMLIVKEHILNWLHEDPELQLRDIVVMAPDIQEYAPLIPAIFDTIQHSIADRSLRRRNSILAAFADFLGLFVGRFSWEDLLDLLHEPEIAATCMLSQTDLANLQRWVLAAGVRWGLSAEQRREDGLPGFGEGSWEDGLARLLMGYAAQQEGFVDGVLPFQGVEGSGAAALGGLCHFVGLVEEARGEFSRSRTLAEWAVLLQDYGERLFCGEQDRTQVGRDYLELLEVIAELGAIESDYHHGLVDFGVVSAWVEHAAKETRSASGFLRGQLTFCSMLPMRSIPFRKVCLLGMGDSGFPREDRHATFDLMGAGHRPGDRSRRMDDRYQFLEAIMAARDQLYLSYVGQSVRNNEVLEPSVVVSELLEILVGRYRAAHLVVHHPLHPFSARYFTGEESNLFSYDETALQVARTIEEGHAPGDGGWWSGAISDVDREIDFDQLCSFFRNPQRWFVRNSLSIRLDLDTTVVPDSEPFTLDGLEDFQVNAMLLKELGHGSSPGELCRRLQAESRWMLGAPGRLALQERVAKLREFMERLSVLGMGDGAAPLAINLDIDGYHLTGTLDNLYDQGILLARYGAFHERELLVGWLHRLVHERLTGLRLPVVVGARDKCMVIPGGGKTVPTLRAMIALFVEGKRQPSRLLLNPGLVLIRNPDDPEAMERARAAFLRQLEQGYDPELALLVRNSDPLDFLDGRFVEVTRNVLEPIMRRAHGC